MLNQKLQQDNIESFKNNGSLASLSIPTDKLRLLDEQLLKSKDEVIELQKKLFEV